LLFESNKALQDQHHALDEMKPLPPEEEQNNIDAAAGEEKKP
jgi:hypothetical protein